MCKTGTQFIGNKGEIKIDSSNVREVRMRLGNYVNITNTPKDGKQPALPAKTVLEGIRTVKVTLLYHTTGK